MNDYYTWEDLSDNMKSRVKESKEIVRQMAAATYSLKKVAQYHATQDELRELQRAVFVARNIANRLAAHALETLRTKKL